MRIQFIGAVVVSVVAAWGAGARAEQLWYRFQDTPQAIYDVSIKMELPDADETHSGRITYDIKSVDPANGQITFGYSKSFHVDRKSSQPPSNPFAHIPPPRGMFGSMGQAAPEIVIDSQGKVIRTNRAGDGDQLPGMLGLCWQLLLPTLPPDEKPMKSERDISLYSKRQESGWPPPPPWERGQDERTDRAAHETVTETIGERNGNSVTIAKQFELATEEKVGDTPVDKASGDGKFVFDPQLGLVQSMEYKQTIEVNQKNMTIKVPVTVTARLLNADEMVKVKEEQAAADAKAKEESAKMQTRVTRERANQVEDLPENCLKTVQVGGTGGSPFIKIHKDRLPVLGFTIRVGNWAGHKTIAHAEPLFEKPDDMNPDDATICLAKGGYVVGGIIVYNKKDGADGMKIVFMKKTGTSVDPKDQYLSPAFGLTEGTTATQLDGKGKLVIGTFGRQGMNMDAVGLILAVNDEDQTKHAAKD